MDLTLSATEQAFRDRLRAWLADNVPSFAGRKRAENPEYMRFLRDWQRRLFDAGYSGLTWPEAFGGRGATPVEQALLIEEMARVKAPDIIGALGIGLIGPTIIAVGTEEQKRRYLEPILSGEEIWCQGFSEPDSGSDLASLATRAVRDGDHYVVNGQKIWTSYAHVSDYCFLLVRTDPGGSKHKGITCLLVDMKSEGVSVKPLRMITGDAAFNEIFFTDVRVPVGQVLGEVDGGWRVAITALMNERTNLGAGVRIMLSQFLDALIEALPLIPRPGGRTAADDPLVRQKIAQAHLELEVFRMTSTRALAGIASGGVPGPEGSILKLFWSELNQRTSQAAMEIAGPFSQLADDSEVWGRLSYFFLRCRGNTIEAGTSEVMRNIIAERVFRLPKSY